MFRIKDNRHLLGLIFSSKMADEERRKLLQHMLENGEVTENEVAAHMINHIEEHEGEYRALFEQDEILQFLWDRFRDRPSYLARALVRARPEIFYCYGFAFRLCIKLRANLGRVWIRPRRNGESDGLESEPTPIAQLPQEVQEDIFALDFECRFREFLYYFSRNFKDGMELLDAEIEHAKSVYDRRVLQAVRLLAKRLIDTRYPGTVDSLNGQPFPALHVRWWLDQSRRQERVLNMGDTGAYKTAYATLSLRLCGCKRVLVITAPHARNNWARELQLYFVEPPKVHVIRTLEDVDVIDPSAEFVIVGYSNLVRSSVVDALIAEQFDGMIQDESHYGKNVHATNPAARATATTRLIHELPLRMYRALSATPWENRPEELASIGAALRPELFTSAEAFLGSGAAKNPRLLRELFAEHILEIELREVRDLPNIDPKPWEDLFGAVPVEMNRVQAEIYRCVYEDDTEELEPGQKAMRLLMAVTHPPLLAERMEGNDELQRLIGNAGCSTKLEWIRRFVSERITTHKIVIGTGLYAEGITRSEDDETETVATLLREWFGEERLLVLDGKVVIKSSDGQESPREAIIRRWRTDPEARILLVSTAACPDSVNLSIGRLPGVDRLAITALSFGWKPWKQFLGRFWREGQAVPVEYAVPVLVGTIDEDLLRMNREKWEAQQLFRALAPITDREWRFLGKDGPERLRELLRDSVEHVNILSSLFRGRGERGSRSVMDALYGASTRAEAFARHFLQSQETSTWGDVANYMRNVIREWERVGVVNLDRILDAGCGPLTLERWLNAPVYGVDMNPHMIALGKAASALGGPHVRVGFLSELPAEWSGMFDLVAASLVIDYSSLDELSQGEPERLRILRELVRVCHPHGLVWLTWNSSYQDEVCLGNWVRALTAEGAVVRRELTGKIRALDNPQKPCEFWSLVFSPNGTHPGFTDPEPYRLPFELMRERDKRGSRGKRDTSPQRIRLSHEQFEVIGLDQTRRDIDAAKRAVMEEVMRWTRTSASERRVTRGQEELVKLIYEQIPDKRNAWRVLARLHELGVLQT
jgi:hypothetical protein